MKTEDQIKKKLEKLKKDYSPDGRSIRLYGTLAIVNRELQKQLKWVLTNNKNQNGKQKL